MVISLTRAKFKSHSSWEHLSVVWCVLSMCKYLGLLLVLHIEQGTQYKLIYTNILSKCVSQITHRYEKNYDKVNN